MGLCFNLFLISFCRLSLHSMCVCVSLELLMAFRAILGECRVKCASNPFESNITVRCVCPTLSMLVRDG